MPRLLDLIMRDFHSPYAKEGSEVVLWREDGGHEPLGTNYRPLLINQDRWEIEGDQATNYVIFPAAAEDWGTIRYWGIVKGNKIIYKHRINPPKYIRKGDSINIRLSHGLY